MEEQKIFHFDLYRRYEKEDNEYCSDCRMKSFINDIPNDLPAKMEKLELRCGHYYHLYCARSLKWFNETIRCTYCGEVEYKDDNQWCEKCEVWGRHKH